MKNPYEDCPKFNICSVNCCPLDSLINSRVTEKGEKCLLRKKTRLEIVKKYPDFSFVFGGLTKKEFIRKNASDRAKGRFWGDGS